jgi:hypothetical protein
VGEGTSLPRFRLHLLELVNLEDGGPILRLVLGGPMIRLVLGGKRRLSPMAHTPLLSDRPIATPRPVKLAPGVQPRLQLTERRPTETLDLDLTLGAQHRLWPLERTFSNRRPIAFTVW